ncbi:hypothetical protein AND_002338 [Anopheles darlingi]|uniref:Uncharacterized protein n=1 Tax=Anopheles darlingi TaxID=43151 RepID=W5JSK0_ANODA|nr:hypothetical protein AND_002338 [Anopheles darlingi]
MPRIEAIVLSVLLSSHFLVGFAQNDEYGRIAALRKRSAQPKTMTIGPVVPEWQNVNLEQNRLITYIGCIFINAHLTESETVPRGYFTGDERTKSATCVVFENSTMDRLPKELVPAFPNAVNLVLEHLQIRTIERGAFDKGEKLEELNLDHNNITHLELGVFSALRELRVLSLDHNQISRLAPGLFAFNAKLAQVYLNGNRLTKIEDNTFSNISEMVYLSNNNLERLDFSQFSKVTILDVSLNRLTEVKVQNGVNKRLQELSLRGNRLTNISWLARFRALKEVDLAHNEIQQVLPEYFPAEMPLKNLLMNNNRLIRFDIPPAHLRQLRWVELSYNLLTAIDLSSPLLDKLEFLYLRNNNIKTLKVSPNNTLFTVSLSNNDWDCANLRQQLAVIPSESLRASDEPPCKAGYIMERGYCCKESNMLPH